MFVVTFRAASAWFLGVVVLAAGVAQAAGPRVLPTGQTPPDQRLAPPKDLDGYFPFQPSASPEEWAQRAKELRARMLVALGLHPMPEKTPLNAVIHGKVERDGYTVEKAYFESFPGFFVTGSLYRPTGGAGKRPAVLCPHGHWADGRFHDAGEEAARQQIAQGAEKTIEAARSPLQARCAHLARMGAVVFHYDMLGYADSQQISFDVAHRFAKQRPEMAGLESWGLFSPQAESHLQSVMGLQTWNSIRALDFVESLPDVDPARIGVTGASGGGTQTFILCGVDDRPAVSFPAVMVSTAMQGGCTCENCCLLRIDTGNVEFAALFAPKPQGMTAADDWTKEMATKGFPELKRHYEMLGAGDNVVLSNHTEFGHNYNLVSRTAMYELFNRHLQLGQPEPIVEPELVRLTRAELSVWDAEHPAPQGGPEFEKSLLAHWRGDADRQLERLAPRDRASLDAWKEVVGKGVGALVGRKLPPASDLEYEQLVENERTGYLEMAGVLRLKSRGEVLPIAFLHPANWNRKVVIWVDENGKSGLFGDDGGPRTEIRSLVDAGFSVVGVDLFLQGEFLTEGETVERTRRVANTRESAAYTFGYNPTLFAQRVHDLLTVTAFVRSHESMPESVTMVGLGKVGPLVALARSQAASGIDRAAIDTRGFRFLAVSDLHSVDFLPGGAKYGDLPGMLALAAPQALWLAGEGATPPPLVAAAYQAADAAGQVECFAGAREEAARAAANWILKTP